GREAFGARQGVVGPGPPGHEAGVGRGKRLGACDEAEDGRSGKVVEPMGPAGHGWFRIRIGNRDYNTPSRSRSTPMRSRWSRILPLLPLAALTTSLAAHDLFLKLADFIVRSETTVSITALNGTFTTSTN